MKPTNEKEWRGTGPQDRTGLRRANRDPQNGKQVSIFAPRYNSYNKGSGQQRETQVNKLDSDFFVERSETMLSDENIVTQILDFRSQGGFIEEARAVGFIKNVLKLNDELSTSTQGDLKQGSRHFQRVMGKKLHAWLDRALSGRQDWLVTYTIKGSSKPMLVELTEAGFFKREDFNQPGTWGMKILEQLPR